MYGANSSLKYAEEFRKQTDYISIVFIHTESARAGALVPVSLQVFSLGWSPFLSFFFSRNMIQQQRVRSSLSFPSLFILLSQRLRRRKTSFARKPPSLGRTAVGGLWWRDRRRIRPLGLPSSSLLVLHRAWLLRFSSSCEKTASLVSHASEGGREGEV